MGKHLLSENNVRVWERGGGEENTIKHGTLCVGEAQTLEIRPSPM